jgi:hypothetical protein
MHEQSPTQRKKENQKRLLDLAVTYRGWSRRELAKALGRDASSVTAVNGNPKLDIVARLAKVLDWPVGAVAETILGEELPAAPALTEADLSFEALDEAAKEAHRKGDYERMCSLARRMTAAARTAEERALAALREAGGWDGLGRYIALLDAVRRGAEESELPRDLRLLIDVNLANAHYTLWHLTEARGLASALVRELEADPPQSRRARAAQAFADYVFGHASRRMIGHDPLRKAGYATAAVEALRRAEDRYLALAEEFDHDPWRGIANTCRGGIIEAEVELDQRSASDAIRAFSDAVETIDPGAEGLAGDRLESWGWWCIFGCNTSLRHLDGSELQRAVKRFSHVGYAIARRLDNWAMRERLYTLEFEQRRRLEMLAGVPIDWTLRTEGIREIVGTMGRFPRFRETGWRILRAATVAEPA